MHEAIRCPIPTRTKPIPQNKRDNRGVRAGVKGGGCTCNGTILLAQRFDILHGG
jgi:hypothetical protein